MSVLPPGADISMTGRFAPEAAGGGIDIQLPLNPESRINLEIATRPKIRQNSHST
jgi:hypothetical protein